LNLVSYDNGDTFYNDGSDYGVTLNVIGNLTVDSEGKIAADGFGYLAPTSIGTGHGTGSVLHQDKMLL
jgi:hypothetical protein